MDKKWDAEAAFAVIPLNSASSMASFLYTAEQPSYIQRHRKSYALYLNRCSYRMNLFVSYRAQQLNYIWTSAAFKAKYNISSSYFLHKRISNGREYSKFN